ncbi:MAG: PKD-like family lipoprotein [Rikenellaceae bacterium]|nr:PKD-like family lipoprotein [Rikenellaceae bacterium]MCL2693381.1 PKD-like family lipoprotein [Rikenellaceae bacterium]
MKRSFYITAVALLTFVFSGCYKDKGNYDYISLAEVTIETTSGIYTFNQKLGDHLTIPMTVTVRGGISESDLTYQWDFKNSAVFRDLEGHTGKNFDRDLGPDGYFNTYGTFITRLRATWVENGFTFEAFSPLISIVLSGDPGLMVLHGDNTGLDVGMVIDNMFLVLAASSTTEKVVYNSYSSVNGSRIPGEGITVIQQDNTNVANAWCFVLTDLGMVFFEPVNFQKLGDYDDLFFSVSGRKYYQGKPEAIFCWSPRAVIDSGDIFYQFAGSQFGLRTEFIWSGVNYLPEYKVSKHAIFANGRGITNLVAFDELQRRIIRFGTLSTGGSSNVLWLFDSNNGPFNLNNMQADLLHLSWGGMISNQDNFVGVFKDDTDELFLGEFRVTGADAVNNTWAQFKYSVDLLPNFADAKFYGFGITNNLCYYATDNAVYQFGLAGATGTTVGRKLLYGIDSPVDFPFSGEITMMKVFRPSLSSMTAATYYHLYGEVLLVGTYENGEGTLYAIRLSQGNGNAISYKSWGGFGRIYDADLKTR